MIKIDTLLTERGLKRTPARLAVLQLFCMDHKTTYSASEIIELLSPHTDRVTIFRTLNTLEEHHLLHKIIDFTGIAQYALTKVDAAVNHAHFFCVRCEEIECIHDFVIDLTQYKSRYASIDEVSTNLRGVCKTCA